MALPLLRMFSTATRPQLAVMSRRMTSMQGQWRLVASVAHDVVEERSSSDFLESLSTKDTAIFKDTKKSILSDYASRNITFVDPNGGNHIFRISDDETILDIAKAKGLEIEGACQGECACSTCHVIIASKEEYERLPPSTEKEEDMLDLAFGVTSTSRLACQLRMTTELDGICIKLPGVARDARAGM